MAAGTTSLRVRYAETDRMGVVYYAHYFVWFEVARAELLRSLGWSYREMEETGVLLPVLDAQCQYRRPARYDDQVRVTAEGRIASAVRMEFVYDVMIDRESEPIARGRTSHAAVGPDGRPRRLPGRILEVFS
jgi:acyl-CoA thioester hydrolase